MPRLLGLILFSFFVLILAFQTLKANSEPSSASLSIKVNANEFITTVPFRDENYRLELYRTNVYSDNFKVHNNSRNISVDSIRTYSGFVKGTNYVATAIVSESNIRIKIFTEINVISATKENLAKTSDFSISAQDHSNTQVNYQEAITNPLPTFAQPKSQSACGVKKATVSFDCSGDCYQFFSQDANAVNQEVAEAINALNVIYVRDLRVELELGSILIRDNADTDPYASLSEGGDLLDALRDDWNANDRGDFDLAALIDPDIGGGLAYVGTVCGSFKYSINGLGSSFIPILRHELGHNFGSNHFEGGSPEGETIMSGNSIARFSGPEKDVIMQSMPSFTCLEDIGNFASPVEPYAHFDDATVEQNQSQMISVLTNDEDANCDTLSLESVDATSSLGNSLSISGSDILYNANSTNTGTDTFTYKVADGTGQVATGNVRVQVTAAPTPPAPPPEPETSSGGGSFSFWLSFLLIPIALHRRREG